MERRLGILGGDDVVDAPGRGGRTVGQRVPELAWVYKDDDVPHLGSPKGAQHPLLEEAQVKAVGRKQGVLEAAFQEFQRATHRRRASEGSSRPAASARLGVSGP